MKLRTNVRACPNCGHEGPGYRHGPTGYVEWQEWANKLSKTHRQLPCPNCGRLTVWKEKRRVR